MSARNSELPVPYYKRFYAEPAKLHRLFAECFKHAKDRETFEWIKQEMDKQRPAERPLQWAPGPPSADWPVDAEQPAGWARSLLWKYGLLQAAFSNKNHFAIKMAREVFGATIDDFGPSGGGGEDGLRMAIQAGMLDTVLESNVGRPAIEVAAAVYVECMSSPHRDRLTEKMAAALAALFPAEEFAPHIRSFRSMWPFHHSPKFLVRAIAMFKPNIHVLLQMHRRITLNPRYGRWGSILADNNKTESETVRVLEAALPPLAAPQNTEQEPDLGELFDHEVREHATRELSRALLDFVYDVPSHRLVSSRMQKIVKELVASTETVLPRAAELVGMSAKEHVDAGRRIAAHILDRADTDAAQQILAAAREDVLERSR